MGPTGSGKSSFIQLATGHEQVTIGHDLRSCTHEVQAFRCPHPIDSGRSVIFIDTPGFDDTNTKDTDILKSIADWLTETYKNGITLTGLLFLHRITDNRMAGTPLRNLHMFERLCGIDALQNVMLVTTMWDEVYDMAIGLAHEEELKAKYWNSMLNVGSRILRFGYTHQSAWTIVDQFTGIRDRVPLQLQVELVDEGKDLSQTAAGSALYQWLEGLITQLRELLAKL
ncbi:P-loop containing nucleoside triphosphate hydrolase protein, partial [Collybia nuda]